MGRQTPTLSSASPDFTVSIFDGPRAARTVRLNSFGKQMVTFGRAKDNDIILESNFISKYHGRFILTNSQWYLEDVASTNGIYLDGQKICSAPLAPGENFRVDNPFNPADRGVSFLAELTVGANEWQSFGLAGREEITIGRDACCDIVLPHLGVSRIHARVSIHGDEYWLYDLSTNGICVNGHMVSGKERLKEKDLIVITNTKLIFTRHRISWLFSSSGIGVDSIDLVKQVVSGGVTKNISNHITLSIKPCEFVAIVGGSGAGKSTFLNCISGYDRATSGNVIINGENLYANYEAMKSIIGYVPQQDIVYDNLTLIDMLSFAAKLRMPSDTSYWELKDRVQQVISTVELAGHEKTFIRQLSGGQKKRASIAVELLSDPNLFFLDEPTSGLDPGTERNLMYTLKSMTNAGKTVVLVTHNTLNLHLCDKIIFLARGGNLCYCGSPEDAFKFFGVESLVDVYPMLDAESEKWCKRYASSEYCCIPQNNGVTVADISNKGGRKSQSVARQLCILCQRYIKLITNDRQRLILLMAQALLLGVLLWLVSNGNTFVQYNDTKAIVFALACSAFWIGILNAIQEICKEHVILKREYTASLSLTAYVLSKFLILGLFCLIQSILLVGSFALLVGLPVEGLLFSPFIEALLTTYLSMLSAMGLGVFVSSLCPNPDRAMTIAPILLMPQILFSGLAFELTGIIKKISAIITCRWSMEALGTSANLNSLPTALQQVYPNVVHEPEEFFKYTSAHLCTTWGILAASVVLFAILSAFTTKRSLKQ